MYKRILAYFQKKFNPKQAQVEAICHTMNLSLAYGFTAINWEGW